MAHIHSMARLGRYAEVAACLAAGADADAVSPRGSTPLMLACRAGHAEIVCLLLKAGADPNVRTAKGHTALRSAVDGRRIGIVGVLLEHGADADPVDTHGHTPVQWAAMRGDVQIVGLLRTHGADMARPGPGGLSAEQWTAEGGVSGRTRRQHPEWFPTEDGTLPLADAGSHAAVREQMAEGLTAEEYAAKHGRLILVYSFGMYRYDDPEVEAFARRVWEVLSTPGLLGECEERYLTGEELEAARRCRARLERAEGRDARRGRILPRREEP